MKLFPRVVVSASFCLLASWTWAQAPLGKEQATSLVTQVLSERGVALQSVDGAGTRFKSALFAFDSDSGVHYVGCYTFTVANGSIKVTVTDIKFASGMPSLFPVPAKLLNGLTAPLQERLQALSGGSATATAGVTAGAGVAGAVQQARPEPTINTLGEPMKPSPDGLMQARPPGENLVIQPGSSDVLDTADILGVNLNLSAAQAAKVLDGKAKWTVRPLKTGLGTEYKHAEPVVGSARYRCATGGACLFKNATELVSTYALPGQPNLVGIHRVRIYGDNEKPLLRETIKALQDKYGREMFHTSYQQAAWAPEYHMAWVTNVSSGVRATEGMLELVNPKPAQGCPMSYFPFVPLPKWGIEKAFFSGIDDTAAIGNPEFASEMLRVWRKQTPISGCGTALGVLITLDKNRDYVARIEVGLTNYARLEDQMYMLAKDFMEGNADARSKKMDADKSRKPDL